MDNLIYNNVRKMAAIKNKWRNEEKEGWKRSAWITIATFKYFQHHSLLLKVSLFQKFSNEPRLTLVGHSMPFSVHEKWRQQKIKAQWEIEISCQLLPVRIGMLMERPKIHQALKHAFWKIARESSWCWWWRKVFCWHRKWSKHFL